MRTALTKMLGKAGIKVIIDAHMHADLLGFDEQKLQSYLDENRIDQCWLLTWDEANPSIPERHQQLSIERLMEVHDRLPGRVVPMYAPDPNRPDAVEQLRAWHARGIKGCAELKVELSWDAPELDALLDCVNELEMPLTFHMEEGNTFLIPENDSALDKNLAVWLRPTKYKGPFVQNAENRGKRISSA